jgi:hypothetical protein
MNGGEWNTSRERKQQATDAREADRERIRLEKRQLRDFRWTAERSKLRESDWADLLTLHQAHGKEGLNQLWLELVPYWSQCQRLNGGAPCPSHHTPAWVAEIAPKLSVENPRTKPTTRKAPGAPRKTRADKGTTGRTYKTRKTKTLG